MKYIYLYTLHNLFRFIIVLCLTTFSFQPLHTQAQEKNTFKNEADLATALLAAKSDAERTELLEINKSIVTPLLGKIFLLQSLRLAKESQYDEAKPFASIYHLIVSRFGSKREMYDALSLLGAISLYQNDYEQALIYYNKCLRLAEELNDKSLVVSALYPRVVINRNLGNYEQALEDAEKSLKLSLELRDKETVGKTQYELGAANYFLGDYTKALKSYQEAKATFEELDNKSGVQTVLNAIGSVYGSQSNYTQAIEYYGQSVKIAEAINDKKGVALSTNNIGVINYLQGNYQTAVDKFQLSLKVAEQATDKNIIALSLNNLGIAYFGLSDDKQSLDYSRKSLALAEQIGDRERISESLNNIARTLNRMGSFAEAVGVVERAISTAQQIKQPERLWESYTTAGKIYSSLKQFDKSRRSFEKAIATIENVRTQVAGGEQARLLFLSGNVAPYHEMIDSLLRDNLTSEAFVYAERAKGRTLLDILRGVKSQVAQSMMVAEKDEDKKLKEEISQLTSEILREENKDKPDEKKLSDLTIRLQKSRQRYEDFITKLYVSHPELKTRYSDVETITPDSVNNLLRNQSIAVLEYVYAENFVGLFVITDDPKTTRSVIKYFPITTSPKELKKRIEDFVKAVTERRANFDVLGRSLYNTLIGPAEKEIKGKRSLCIVPDGAIWKVPFQALQNGERYLIHDFAIFAVPSLSVLDVMQKSSARHNETAKDLLAFANPSFSVSSTQVAENTRGKKLTPLLEAENEGKAIMQMYKQNGTLYIRKDAQESRFKNEARDYRILHFATHGFLDDLNPLYSYLVLAQTSTNRDEDGLLTANEIMLLNLNADMAVLSACETALGEYRAGEGVIGMTWSFFAAGVPTTVASQWSVETVSTTRLMTEFHCVLKSAKQHSGNGRDVVKAEAMRQAQLKLIKSEKYSLPYYWAGFTVIGSPW